MKSFKRENNYKFGYLTERNNESDFLIFETPKKTKNKLIKSYYSLNKNDLNNFKTSFSFNRNLKKNNKILKTNPLMIYSNQSSINKYNKIKLIFNNQNINSSLFGKDNNFNNVFKNYKPMKRYYISSLNNISSLYDNNGVFLNKRKELNPLSKNQKLRIKDNKEINSFRIFN